MLHKSVYLLPGEVKTFTQDTTVSLPLEEKGNIFPKNDPEINGWMSWAKCQWISAIEADCKALKC